MSVLDAPKTGGVSRLPMSAPPLFTLARSVGEKPPLPTAASARSVVSLPQAMPSAQPQSPIPASVQIALKNAVLPANNTGIAEAAQGSPVVASDTVPPTTRVAGTAAKTRPAAASAVKQSQTPDAPVKKSNQEAAPAQDGGLKKASGLAAYEAAPDASQDADSNSNGVSQNGVNSLPATPQLPATASPEPRVSAGAPADKPLTGAERARIVQQAADGVAAVKPQVLNAGRGQMTVLLHPKEWGDLRVTVQLAPVPATDGVKQATVVAHVVASSPVVKTALENSSADLNQALREAGLHLERLTVTVQPVGAGEQTGGSAADGGNLGQKSQDPWQGTQAGAGNGGMGAGGSSFTSFSERQGYSPPQNQSASRAAYGAGDEGGTGPMPVSSGSARTSVGFDQRA